MSFKDLLVILDETAECAVRLRVAMSLARRYEAHLVGLLVTSHPYMPAYLATEIPPDAFEAQRAFTQETVDKIRVGFEDAVKAEGIGAEWRSAEGSAEEQALLHARYADLTIAGQTNPDTLGSIGTAPHLVEDLALGSGRPVIAVPYAGRFDTIGSRVMIAWDASREAARAVGDAMPLLREADEVSTISVNPRAGGEAGTHGDVPGADIAGHLARHGVKVEARRTVAEDISVGDMLLSRAADLAADLIVMGAYGHSRAREMVLGGATRHLLAHMTAPVLFSH